ncbi:hypothetical protein QO058_18840 [Bosea vestrisii]|nr:hypothetical protein [Bosea vestrisii]WID94865.1 hypothetical protein QO058_18840 [Bosea vestrisii]
MQFADLALGERDNADAAELHSLEESSDVLLIPAHTIKSFGYDDVDLAATGVREERLVTGPEMAGA